eukprot:GSMAST32.ASY1.ANO1.1291.1 assembled CDS
MQLTLREMFRKILKRSNTKDLTYSVKISMIEVYNENIRDLLNPNASPTLYLDLREDPIKGPVVAGVTEVVVRDTKAVMALLQAGNLRRTQESTNANKTSSRSHVCFHDEFKI